MKIVIIHTDFRLYWPARLWSLHRFLSAKGHQFHIIEIAGQGSPYAFAEEVGEKDVLPWECLFPEKKMEELSAAEAGRCLNKRLEKMQPDIVLAGAIAYPSGAAAVRWCKEKGRPVVIFDNARLEDVPRLWIVNYIKRCIYRNVDAVISPAPSQAGAFEYWGVSKGRIFFGLNVVDNDWFAQRVTRKEEDLLQLKKELDLPSQFLLGVGRLVAKKNWLRLVQSFTALTKGMTENAWSLVLVGDGPERIKLVDYCKKHEIFNVIIRDFASQEKLCKYYSLASALVLPSKFGETWGLVVNEAMASGLPVLVSSQCGCAESLLEDGRNGYVFPPDDNMAISNALYKFMSLEEKERKEMGQRSAEVIKNWSLDRFSHAAFDAIEYSVRLPKSSPSTFDTIIIKLWKGRYRPT
jgi:1,2-diacylglycerol 3-alpha-glucosyltransferase